MFKMLNLEVLAKKYNLKFKDIAHIGAHSGKEVNVYKKLSPYSKVYLFEPQSKLFKILKSNFEDDKQILLYNIALGSTQKEIKINISSKNTGTSSILKSDLLKNYYPEIEFDSSESVKMRTFDSLSLNNVNFMSVDTQGYELEVLLGSVESLKNIDYLIIEINRKTLYENSPLISDIDKFLSEFEFVRLATMYWGNDCIWGDAFFIRTKYLSKFTLISINLKNFLYKSIIIYKLVRKIKKSLNIK